MFEEKTAPQIQGAEGVKCWKGEPGPEGVIEEGYKFKTDFGSDEDRAALVAGIQESMRREMQLESSRLPDTNKERLPMFPDDR